MQPITVTVGPLAAASANAIATTQTPVSGTALTLNGTAVTGGLAALDKPRRVLLTFGNEGAARTLTLTGTGLTGQVQSEVLAVASGAGATIASVLDYATITQAMPGGSGWTAAVTLGTNGAAASPWVAGDSWAMSQTGVQCVVTGTANYTVQVTQDDPNALTRPVPINAVAWSPAVDATLVDATTTVFGGIAYTPKFSRVLLNSGTGSVTATFAQFSHSVTA